MNNKSQWPDSLAERYVREGYWRGEVLGSVLRDWPSIHANKVAIVDMERRWTYNQLDQAADRLASGFLAMGLEQGDRVVVQLPNGGSFAKTVIALFRAGVIPVFALPMHRRSEIVYLCNHAEASAYITASTIAGFDCRQLARDVRRDAPSVQHILLDGDGQEFRTLHEVEAEPVPIPVPSPSDIAFLLLSGGSTGLPKLIPRTHDDYMYQLRATAEGLGVNEESVYLAALPVAHNAALGCPGLLGTLFAGGKVVLLPNASPAEAFPLIERENVTLTTLMPPLVQLWLEASEFMDIDLSGMMLQVGSARFAPELALRVQEEWGSPLTHWFGMAEGLLTFTRPGDSSEVARFTVGRPLAKADEIRVVDYDGNDVETGLSGELLTRGPYTIRGYYKADDYNLLSFTPDGYLRTGDLVSIREDGNMVVDGRRKDVINRGGEKVSPGELEDALLLNPSLREAAVVGKPDPLLGEKICAFVVPRGEAISLEELRRFLRQHGLADFKLPDFLFNLPSLPKTKVGKIDRGRMRELTNSDFTEYSMKTV